MFQAPILKRMAMQFVVRNMSSVVRSRDWKECLLDHPALMAEVGCLLWSQHLRNISDFPGDGGDGEERLGRRIQREKISGKLFW